MVNATEPFYTFSTSTDYPEVMTSLETEGNFTDIDSLLLARLGLRRRDMVSTISLTVVYGLIFVSGTIGNICTCVIVNANHHMQTVTNYYLTSLAVADLLMLLLGMPQEMYLIWEAYPWRFGVGFCVFKSLLMEVTANSSVLTITAFTFERYLAICRPIFARKMASKERTVKVIVIIWIVAVCLTLPYPIHTRLFYEITHPVTGNPISESLVCNIPGRWRHRMAYVFQVSTFLFFITPLTVITVLYIFIVLAIRRSRSLRAGSASERTNSPPSHSQRSSTSHIHHQHSLQQSNQALPTGHRRVKLKLLVGVVVAFFVCWAPFQAQRLMTVYVSNWSPKLLEVQGDLFYISGALYFFSSTVNPILYNLMSRRYRVAFKQTLCRCLFRTTHSSGLRNRKGSEHSLAACAAKCNETETTRAPQDSYCRRCHGDNQKTKTNEKQDTDAHRTCERIYRVEVDSEIESETPLMRIDSVIVNSNGTCSMPPISVTVSISNPKHCNKCSTGHIDNNVSPMPCSCASV